MYRAKMAIGLLEDQSEKRPNRTRVVSCFSYVKPWLCLLQSKNPSLFQPTADGENKKSSSHWDLFCPYHVVRNVMWGWVLAGNIFSKHWLSFLIICNKRMHSSDRSERSKYLGWGLGKKNKDVPASVKEKYLSIKAKCQDKRKVFELDN